MEKDMLSQEKRFENVKSIIAESEKPRKHAKEKNVESAIVQLKKELSRL
jgi:hypothetical protein